MVVQSGVVDLSTMVSRVIQVAIAEEVRQQMLVELVTITTLVVAVAEMVALADKVV
jgi:hypothetical protein